LIGTCAQLDVAREIASAVTRKGAVRLLHVSVG
jgi:hypothetical protein